MFKRRILLNQSTKSHFKSLRGRGKELEEIRSKRLKDGGVYIDQFDEIIQECLTKSKNTLIYRRIGRNCPMEAFNLHQRSRLNA